MKKFNLLLLMSLIFGALVFNSCNEEEVEEVEEVEEEEEEEEGTVTDIDGNKYKTVIIGAQEWFAENLRTTRYNDGKAIPTGTNTDWKALTGAYAVYHYSLIDGLNSDQEVLDGYGALYNWYAVNTGKLCPKGWHVPTDAEWTALTNYLGGETGAGGKLKSTRTEPVAHPRWDRLNYSATDVAGFSALPGGYREYGGGTFYLVGRRGLWWSSTEPSTYVAWSRGMYLQDDGVSRNTNDKERGLSVRCLRDK